MISIEFYDYHLTGGTQRGFTARSEVGEVLTSGLSLNAVLEILYRNGYRDALFVDNATSYVLAFRPHVAGADDGRA